MNYANYFGSYQEQGRAIEEIERELFLRKVVMIISFAEVLNESNIQLFLRCKEDYRKPDFEVRKEGYEDPYDMNNLIGIVMSPKNYGLENNFFDTHHNAYMVIESIENLMEMDNVKSMSSPFRLAVNKQSTEWLKLVFEACGKKKLYTEFMCEVMDKELKKKDGKKSTNKV
jgi:hypothetical protein